MGAGQAKPQSVSPVNDRFQELRFKQYYHGMLPRDEVESLLTEDGEFIVRLTRKGESNIYVISVYWKNKVRHFPILYDGESFFLESQRFTTIQDLVAYYQTTREPLTENIQAVLIKPKNMAAWELSNEDIILDEMLGNGNFGEVWKGWYTDSKTAKSEQVAIKLCKETLPDAEKKRFLSEARLMRHYIHPNVIRVIGIAAQREPVMIVMELVTGGGLDKHLVANKGKINVATKIMFGHEAAKGMAYLESMKCIHNDLAARNCLLTGSLRLKISDFGMSRETSVYVAAQGKQLPVRWTALEALPPKYIFSHKSDVWSFGILVWEIFHEGAVPYPEMDNNYEIVQFLKEGKRLQPSSDMPTEIAALMQSCWQKKVPKRPTFADIAKVFLAVREKCTK